MSRALWAAGALLQLALPAAALTQRGRARSGLTAAAVAHSPKESAAMRKEAFEKEFTVELNLAKAREAGTPLGLKVDIESEFAPPSLKVISDDIVRDRLALSCVVAVSIPRRILSAPVPHRHPSRLKTPRCPAQPVGISGPRPVL
ncbi:unnamed protein product [Prorocentrum cordatum]|uniref:Uncharacterized protein n=1 Tax=Prorocentrum cordatum TaxID=2364126 RepID=A0ABN9T674_9DINO|nr:unnamed protein product [Polarella glacialis]